MTTRQLIEVDYATGKEVWHVINGDGTYTVETRWHMDEILDQNRREYNDSQREAEWGRKVASIPLGVLELWRTEDGLDFFDLNAMTDVRRRLNDLDWQKLRTSRERI